MRWNIVTLILGLFAILALGPATTSLDVTSLDVTSLDVQTTKPSGVPVSNAYWKVQVKPGTPIIVLNGTVQSVYAQLLKLNPNYDADWNNTDVPFDLDEEDDYEDDEDDEDDDEEDTTEPDHDVFPMKSILLNAWDPLAPPGLGVSRKASTISTRSRNIAQGASVLVRECAGYRGMDERLVHGNLHHPDTWDVIVEEDGNHC
ncbi:hypothetical protein BDW74DRAFT_176307 [Aspergillus multicolor]|uniref:uncharacterized protein n=1 Tax=Aspergillus multicolor TaxID=41759 RepID=UPI003CCE4EDA